MFSSIRRQLMTGFIGLSITPLLLAGLVSSSASFRAQEQQALALQHATAQRFASEINLLIGQIENEFRQLTRIGNFTALSVEEQRTLLSELVSYQDGLGSVSLLDAHGLERARVERILFVTEVDLSDWSGRDEFLLPTTTGTIYYSPLISNQATDEPVMNLAYPLTNLRTGTVAGVIVGEIRFKKVWDLLRDSNAIRNEEIYVMDMRNYVVAHASPSVVLRETLVNLPSEHGITTGLDGDTVVMAWDDMPLGKQTLKVVAEQPVSEALELAYHTLYVTGGLLAVALIVSVTAGALAVRQIVQPIEQLAETAHKIAAGDLSQRAAAQSPTEIAVLANSFNSMTTQLVTTLDGLETLNADLERRVTERTAELKAANIRLTELDQLKTLFIQDMSHELRTPLSILSTSVYLLEKKPENSADYLQKLRDQIARLTQLANSALDLARLEQKNAAFEPIVLDEIVEQVTSQFKAQSHEAGLKFTVNLDTRSAVIYGERDQLTQVVTHLMTNATNYTQVGSIEVSTSANSEYACLAVRDTGRGIAAEDIPHLFKRFYRGKGVGSSTISGNGLGLAIVKAVVDMLHGSIEVESTVDVGTTFRIWLPLAKDIPE